MLARWLVLRQEGLDLKAGFKWNELVRRAPGDIAQANPNFDIVLSEAWVAVDDNSCTLINLPEIKGRYYTIEIVNGWGEVIDTVNERTYSKHPFGTFALCLNKAKVDLPAGAQRVEVAGKKSRILIPITLGADPAAAVALANGITMRATGAPKIEDAVVTPDFADDKLPGVEAFDKTDEILASETDTNKGMAEPQAMARAVGAAAADPAQRAHIDEVIRGQAIPAFFAAVAKMGQTVDGWIQPHITGNYGRDYLTRSIVDFTRIWADSPRETVYFGSIRFDGSRIYTQSYAKDDLPPFKAHYAWSVTAVDSKDHRVMANPLNRYLFGSQSELQLNADGSLTLVFAPKPLDGVPQTNWLPTPAGREYNLTYRLYVPSKDAVQGRYYPPMLSIKP